MDADAWTVKRLGYAVSDLTIGHVLADKAATHGAKTFLTFLPDGRNFTFRDVHVLSNRIANGLSAAGITAGEHVGVLMENSPEQLLLYFALGKIGAVAVPINTAARGQLLTYYMTHSDAVALIADSDLLVHAEEVAADCGNIGLRIALKSTAETVLPAGVADFATLLEGSEETPAAVAKFSDLAFLLYTSGTTGPSKAIMFTHAYSLLYGIDQAENYGFRETDVVHICLPYFHANGLLSHTYGPLALGASVALSRRFSASNFWREVRESKANVISLLGSMANILWSLPPDPRDAENEVRQATVAPVPSDATGFEKRFGLRLLSTYGLTDYGLGCIFNLDDPLTKLGSAGRPRKYMRIAIVDDNDFQLPPNEVGEIVMRSELPWNTSPGYFKMPEQTLTSRRNFWFHTGDRGFLDDDGYLYFADRKKDSIRRRGENISAFEVEQVIQTHDAVQDTAVFAVSSPLGEDEVAASVVLREGKSVTPAELIEHCRRNMSYFMVPRYIRFAPDLPRSPTHKVEKYKLRKEAEENRALYWDREEAGIVIKRN